MAKRTSDTSAGFTPTLRAALRASPLRVRGGSLAFTWSFFVGMCWLLSCGFCRADTEFSILEEAQVLSEQMKKLSSQELGVFTMQHRCTKWQEVQGAMLGCCRVRLGVKHFRGRGACGL
ncbi:unnamed protein product [Lampetra planeri]